MVEFRIPTTCPRLAIAVAAAHGSTDIVRGKKLLTYAIAALPLPGWCVTIGFAISSLFHFANDVGLLGSVAGHSALLGLHQLGRQQTALTMLLTYMVLVHVPAHYARVYEHDNGPEAVGFAFLFTLTFAMWAPWGTEVALGHFAQRVVISHVLCNSF
jgi:hypothetical protein